MAGRRGMPIDILKKRGKKHLTQEEIKRREENEIKLGGEKFTCPDYVKNDVLALKKWKELVKTFKDFPNVTSSDSGIIARYCVTYSEYLRLIEVRKRIDNIDLSCEKETSDKVRELISAEIGIPETNKLLKKINFIISADGILSFEQAINKKSELLIKMEDRLYLNALAKTRNVPKKEEPKPVSELEKKGFGNV